VTRGMPRTRGDANDSKIPNGFESDSLSAA
jgi:hypothetical protein